MKDVLPVWVSPTVGVIVPNGDAGRGYYRLANPGHFNWRALDALPADAVRLVPESSGRDACGVCRMVPTRWAFPDCPEHGVAATERARRGGGTT